MGISEYNEYNFTFYSYNCNELFANVNTHLFFFFKPTADGYVYVCKQIFL